MGLKTFGRSLWEGERGFTLGGMKRTAKSKESTLTESDTYEKDATAERLSASKSFACVRSVFGTDGVYGADDCARGGRLRDGRTDGRHCD